MNIKQQVEALIFASPKPMKISELRDLLEAHAQIHAQDHPEEAPQTFENLDTILEDLKNEHLGRQGGFALVEVPKLGWQFQTVPEVAPLMVHQFSARPRPLSRAALETLAIIAYRQKRGQGVTRAEVEFIRGVDAGGIFKSLMDRGLISCIGKKEIPGKPLMFAVTDEFLKTFQIQSISDLPALESFQIPQETLKVAQEKIRNFEAEELMEVDPNVFLDDPSRQIETFSGNLDE